MAHQNWTDLDTLIGKTARLNALKNAINVGGRNVCDDDIYLLAVEGHTPENKYIRSLIDNRINIDELKNIIRL